MSSCQELFLKFKESLNDKDEFFIEIGHPANKWNDWNICSYNNKTLNIDDEDKKYIFNLINIKSYNFRHNVNDLNPKIVRFNITKKEI
jgi:flagellar assembly factor FliW